MPVKVLEIYRRVSAPRRLTAKQPALCKSVHGLSDARETKKLTKNRLPLKHIQRKREGFKPFADEMRGD